MINHPHTSKTDGRPLGPYQDEHECSTLMRVGCCAVVAAASGGASREAWVRYRRVYRFSSQGPARSSCSWLSTFWRPRSAGAATAARPCWDTSWRRHRACTQVSRNSRWGEAARASASAASTAGTAAVGAPPATAATCCGGVDRMTWRRRSGWLRRRASRKARRGAPAARAACTAAGVTSAPRSVGSNTAASSSDHSTTPSVVAAAQERPVGASDTARVRMTARRVPPVPGMPPSALGSPPGPSSSPSSSLASSLMRSAGPASVMLREFNWSSTPSSDLFRDTWKRRSMRRSSAS
mmetsp:Transcript_14208/g.42912  ORF Transcript_14208/g.42912 Transcript_14208/m.42912 type:complete len:295 (+) Transcript_14208:1552-2436(+)